MIKRLKIFLLKEVVLKIRDIKSYSENLTKRINDFELKLQNKINFISNKEVIDLFEEVLEVDEIKKPYDYDSSSLFDY